VQAPTEDKCDGTKGSFYEGLECAFDQFPKYQMEDLLEDFNVQVGREDIFKLMVGKN
jgi:hypothetical protein